MDELRGLVLESELELKWPPSKVLTTADHKLLLCVPQPVVFCGPLGVPSVWACLGHFLRWVISESLSSNILLFCAQT